MTDQEQCAHNMARLLWQLLRDGLIFGGYEDDEEAKAEHYRDMAHHLVKQWQKLNQPKGAL